MELISSLITYLAITALDKVEIGKMRFFTSFKRNLKHIALGILCMIFGIATAVLTLIFGAITFFLNFANDLTQYLNAGLWTTGTLAVMTFILFYSGLRFLKRF